jgi:hypothetical protein
MCNRNASSIILVENKSFLSSTLYCFKSEFVYGPHTGEDQIFLVSQEHGTLHSEI